MKFQQKPELTPGEILKLTIGERGSGIYTNVSLALGAESSKKEA